MSSRVKAIIPAGAGFTPSTWRTAFAECCSTQTIGAKARERKSIGTASASASISARCSATAFGTSSPSDDAEVRQHRERDHEGDTAGQEVEVARDERLADRAERDPDDRDPDLDGRDEPDRLVHRLAAPFVRRGCRPPRAPRGARVAP